MLAGKTIVAVAAGFRHSLALDSDGRVYSWGMNSDGQLGSGSGDYSSLVPVAVDFSGVLAGKKIVKIAAGPNFSLALDEEGKVYSWGGNSYGQLGIGSTSRSTVPVAVDASGALLGKTVVQLGAGGLYETGSARYPYAIALLDDGSLVGWGNNSYRQLADGTTTQRTSPIAIPMTGVLTGKSISQISVGPDHVLALDGDGVAYGWGRGGSGQLGEGNAPYTTAPVIAGNFGVLAGKRLSRVVAGASYSIFLDTEGKLYGAGRGDSGQLGSGFDDYSNTPIEVQVSGALSGKDIVDVVAGNRSVLAKASTGEVFAWGYDATGQLGTGLGPLIREPIVVSYLGDLAGKDVVRATFGNNHAMYLDTQGVLYATGGNSYLQLGVAGLTHSFDPVVSAGTLLAGAGVTQFDVGVAHSLVLTDGGDVITYGYNAYGQAGVGTNTQASESAIVQGLLTNKTIVAISAGGNHSLALDSAGVLYAWGYNYHGQIGDGSTTNRTSPVVVNQTGVLAGKTLVDIQAGDGYSIVMDSDGKLYGWGQNNLGQLGNGNTTNQPNPVSVSSMSSVTVTKLSVGMYHSLAIDNQGQVYAWGKNVGGALGDGSTTNRSSAILIDPASFQNIAVADVSAGSYMSFALDANGKPYGWGANGSRNLAVESTQTDVTLPSPVRTDGVLAGKALVTLSVASHDSIFAKDSNGVVYGWGSNASGQLGIGYTYRYLVPKPTMFASAEVLSQSVPQATEYSGPVLRLPGRTNPVLPGDEITISGARLSGVSSITVDGLNVEFEVTGDEVRLVIPIGLSSGTYDLVVQSDSGRLVIQSGLVVKDQVLLSQATTRVKALDGKVKLYASNVVGAGKVQFFLNGREIAWVNASSSADSKLRTANGASYLVRTVELGAGKNVFEVYVDGVRITRTSYSVDHDDPRV